MTDLPFLPPEPEAAITVARTERRCRRHEWGTFWKTDHEGRTVEGWYQCSRCGKPKDEARSRRGRNNRKRGNALQARVAKAAGISNIGALGLPVDAGQSSEWLALQVKSGGSFPKLIDRWLRAITVNANQLRGVVMVETGTVGVKAKRLIVLDFDEFIQWFGK